MSPSQQSEAIRKVYADFTAKLKVMKKRHTTEIESLIQKIEGEKIKHLGAALRVGRKKT